MKKALSLFLFLCFTAQSVLGGIEIVRSEGITLTGADGIRYVGTSGITLTGADRFVSYRLNGITLASAEGITLTGADAASTVGPEGSSYTGRNSITLAAADGITLTGADRVTLTGADGITLTGADGSQHHADSVDVMLPEGLNFLSAEGITLTGADRVDVSGANGTAAVDDDTISMASADGITLTGADGMSLKGSGGITLTGADALRGFDQSGLVFDGLDPAGITLTGADGVRVTAADGITLTGADRPVFRNVDGITLTGADRQGLQNVDPDLAIAMDNATDDTNINAVIVYHDAVTDEDILLLEQAGVLGGTRMRVLPMVIISGTKAQIAAISRSPRVRSIYGNRTIQFNSDPYLKTTGIQRVAPDTSLRSQNGGLAVTGRNVTVAVLDTGINAAHTDLAGRVVQNAKVLDTQSLPSGFSYPVRLENQVNSDPISGHGTFVAGVVAASGDASGGKYDGVAPDAHLLGVSVGDVTLTHVIAGFDYLLDRGADYNVRVVNCSFSSDTTYDDNDPVNVATRMLTDRGVNVVVSAGNSGAGNGTLNPYSRAPWVIGVGATDQSGVLAPFSSKGTFGGKGDHPTLVAPGVNVASIRSSPSITSVSGFGNADLQRLSPFEMPQYTTASGTSFSAPQVAGAIALMLEVNPSLTPAQIKDILARTATPMPRYYSHEAGAGMLNTHAAVIEAAFPARRTGMFRSTLSSNSIQFSTAPTQTFSEMVYPSVTAMIDVPIGNDVVQAGITATWATSGNDFDLKLFNSANLVEAESNNLNLPGVADSREKVALTKPTAQTYRASIGHMLGAGTPQLVDGIIETTQVAYPTMLDLDALSPELRDEAERSLLTNLMLPEGLRFRPDPPMSRYDLAAAFVRAGVVPQYMAPQPLFSDVSGLTARNAVESVQSRPEGRLFYDAPPGGYFDLYSPVSRLGAAIAFVKAANLEDVASSSSLEGVADMSSIPTPWRGYVAVALQRGFMTLDDGYFMPGRAFSRIEAAKALNALVR